MLYVIAEQLGFPGILNLIRYISFRAGAASATALMIGLMAEFVTRNAISLSWNAAR